MAISPVSTSSLDDQVIQSLGASANQTQPSDDSSTTDIFSNALQNLQNDNSLSNNDLAMLQALQGAETNTSSATKSTNDTANALQELQASNTASNDLAMLQALQTTYSGGVSDLLQNIQKIEAANNSVAMLQALQGAGGSADLTNSDTSDVLDTLLDPATDADTIDNNDILDSLLQTSQDSGSSDGSSILQDLQGTDASADSIDPDDVVLQALLQTDNNGGDFINTLQALQNNTTSVN